MAAMTSYFFNTRTGQVEELETKSQSKDLLGPYATRAEAEAALTTAANRTEEWDRKEREWRGEE
jgi:hypothetical protein